MTRHATIQESSGPNRDDSRTTRRSSSLGGSYAAIAHTNTSTKNYGSIDSALVDLGHLEEFEYHGGNNGELLNNEVIRQSVSRRALHAILVVGLAVIFATGVVQMLQRIDDEANADFGRRSSYTAPATTMNLLGDALNSAEDAVAAKTASAMLTAKPETKENMEMTADLIPPLPFVSEIEMPLTGAENDLVRCSCPFPGAPSPFNNYVCYPPAYNAMCAPNEICKEVNIIQVGQPSAIHLGYFMCTDHVCTEGATCSCASPGGAPGNNLPQSNCFVCKNPDGTACVNYVLTGIDQCCPENHICSSVANVNHAIATSNTNAGGLCQVHR